MAVDSKALLAGVGAVYLAFKVLGLLRVLFDVYVRSGINVSVNMVSLIFTCSDFWRSSKSLGQNRVLGQVRFAAGLNKGLAIIRSCKDLLCDQ
jgi:hypothetical protein